MQEEHTTPLEEWRTIAGYEGIYSVSSLGRVRRDAPATGTKPGRILKPQLDTYGYPHVSLSHKCCVRIHKIHRLVAAAFFGTCLDKPEVNHKDGCRSHNAVENLEYVTRQENVEHARRMGFLVRGKTHPSHTHPERVPWGEHQAMSKLTAQQVQEIRAAYIPWKVTNDMLGRQYGVTGSAISAIHRGKNWRRLPKE